VTPLDLAEALTKGKFSRPAHLRQVNLALFQVAQGNLKRLAIFMPPRHGKSETASHYGPTWFLGALPHWRVILSSYEASFAASWGRKVRDSLHEAHELGLFSTDVRGNVSSVSEWETTDGGGMITAGVGGAITGRGANLLIIDDPVKNAEEAASPTYREKAWEWYTSTAYTRLEPGGAVVLMMTRWHQDDLGGRILARAEAGELEGDTEPWHVIQFPALAEENDALGRQVGEALWPERYPVPVLEDRRRTLGSYQFGALFQQRPMAREGGLFRREWFLDKVVDAPPAGADVHRVRRWDAAATEAGGDYTAGVRMSLTPNGLYCVENVQRGQFSPGAVDSLIAATAEGDGREVHIREEQEPGSAGKTVVTNRASRLRGYDYRGRRSTGSKEIRASAFAAQAEAGNVRLVRGPWNAEYLEELCAFPTGAHDDQVDASSGAFDDLNQLARRARPARSYQG